MKKFSLKIFATILFMFLFIGSVGATSLGLFDETVNQEGEYNSIRFIGGNNVNNKATIDGISFGFGNNVASNGKVTYGVYAGNVININENVEKDLFVAGNNITISDGAVLGRDAFIAGSTINIYADVARDLRAGGSIVSLKGVTIGGDAIIDAERIVLDENTTITGKLSYPTNAEIQGLNLATIGSVETRIVEDVDIEETVGAFNTYIFVTWTKVEASEIFKTSMKGLIVLIVVPVVVLFTLFTGLLTPVSLIVLSLYCICIYLSSLFAAYVIGYTIMLKGFKVKKDRYALSIMLGIALVRILCLIPIIGGLLSFILLIYGLGLIYVLINTNIKKK